MTRREQLWENYDDALFALLMDEVAVTQGKEAAEENARLAQDEDAQVPDDVTSRCLAAISRRFRRQRLRAVGRGTWAVAKKVPVLVTLCTFLFVGAFAVSPEVRSSTMRFVMELYPNELVVGYSPVDGEAGDLRPGEPPLEVGWVPDGFELQNEVVDPTMVYYYFTEPGGGYIDITLLLSSNSVGVIDTEDAAVEDVTVQGMQTKLVTRSDEYSIVWADVERSYLLTITASGIEKEDIIRVAEELIIN